MPVLADFVLRSVRIEAGGDDIVDAQRVRVDHQCVRCRLFWSNRALAVGSSRATANDGQLIALATSVDEHRQQITVIDPADRVMSVYHIELATGKVTLKSVRKIHWDLEMSDFNAVSPLPREIRTLLEQRR